jgi:uncharacterized membrane protein
LGVVELESRAKFLGHAIHPMLIVYPLGLFSTAVLFDVIRLVRGGGGWGEAAFYDIAVGVIAGLAAAAAGFIDWLAIRSGTRAKAIGLWHGGGNFLIVVLFIISWLLRLPNPSAPPLIAFVLALIAVGMALVTGWLGGELVERLGVGVDENAGLDAPSSLRSRAPGRRAVE